jgi:hypothetical protein
MQHPGKNLNIGCFICCWDFVLLGMTDRWTEREMMGDDGMSVGDEGKWFLAGQSLNVRGAAQFGAPSLITDSRNYQLGMYIAIYLRIYRRPFTRIPPSPNLYPTHTIYLLTAYRPSCP